MSAPLVNLGGISPAELRHEARREISIYGPAATFWVLRGLSNIQKDESIEKQATYPLLKAKLITKDELPASQQRLAYSCGEIKSGLWKPDKYYGYASR